VVFILGALPVIWVGYLRRWAFVRNCYFRSIHLLLVGTVAAESLFGIWCPLTTWEEALRGEPMRQNSFVAHWLHILLFYDFPAWVFTAAYILFFLLVLATFCFVRVTWMPRPDL
jgi:hypothetical protein